jgi:GWxTD domain-containing protein
MRNCLLTVLLLSITGLYGLGAVSKEDEPQHPLNDRHKEWLEAEVVYIISDKEKEVFLQLESDLLRDQFIQMFWKQRDPTPATSYNEFQEEHYRRISYANMWFGHRASKDGWRSDRGRIYILFGEPGEKTKFTGENDIRDCELWFYDSKGLLEDVRFFQLIFYQKTFAHDFVLYNPTHDGPEELAMQIAPTRQQALDYLYERAGQALWHAAQTYIPSEPLGGTWSPQSELLLSSIDNIRNSVIDSTWAESFLATRGRVSTRLSFKNLPLHIVTAGIFNQEKEAFFHAGFEIRPEDLKVGDIDGRFYAIFDIRTVVEDAKTGKEILARVNHWETQFKEENGQPLAKPISFSQVFTLVPGHYKLLWVIDDLITETFSFRQMEIVIPDPNGSLPVVTTPLLTRRYEMLDQLKSNEIYPFRIFNIQYDPDLSDTYNKGDNLSVFFQYLLPDESEIPEEVQFEILLTRQEIPQKDPVRFEHSVPRDRISEDRVVFIHRQIPVANLQPGQYELVVEAKQNGGLSAESDKIHFTYHGEEILIRSRPDPLLSGPKIISERYWLERSRQYELLERTSEAISELERVLAENPEAAEVEQRLAELKSKGNIG